MPKSAYIHINNRACCTHQTDGRTLSGDFGFHSHHPLASHSLVSRKRVRPTPNGSPRAEKAERETGANQPARKTLTGNTPKEKDAMKRFVGRLVLVAFIAVAATGCGGFYMGGSVGYPDYPTPIPPRPLPQPPSDIPVPPGAVRLHPTVAAELAGHTVFVQAPTSETRGVIEDSVRAAGAQISVGGRFDYMITAQPQVYSRDTGWIQTSPPIGWNSQVLVMEVRVIRQADNVLAFRGPGQASYNPQSNLSQLRANIISTRDALAKLR